MSKISLILFLVLSLLLGGCSSTSNLTQLNTRAATASQSGDFEKAFATYDTYITDQKTKNKEVSGEVYGLAAQAAFRAKNFTKADEYFKQATYKAYANVDLVEDMIQVYHQIDNLSKEMDALEAFEKNYPQDSRFKENQKRLFETYIESENWDKAVALWSSFTSVQKADIHLLELYLTAQKNLDHDAEASQLALSILKKNAKSKIALDWMAQKYFWKAENRYQKEIAAYAKNKSTKQYNVMLKALDIVSSNFKKSLKYYQALYKYYPTKKYAKSISNIYLRFQDKKKAAYYKSLSK